MKRIRENLSEKCFSPRPRSGRPRGMGPGRIVRIGSKEVAACFRRGLLAFSQPGPQVKSEGMWRVKPRHENN
jgi:hypothetical protein